MGLPHTIEGYAQAKKILEENYIMGIYIHKRLIMELETLPKIINIIQMKDMHESNKIKLQHKNTNIPDFKNIQGRGKGGEKAPPPPPPPLPVFPR